MTMVPIYELPYFAGNVLATIWLMGEKDRATIVALRGDLGSGKTTFVQTLCKRLGIAGPVQSPTYVLMRIYPLDGPTTSFGEKRRFNRVVHIDAYRLENPEEFASLRPEEFLQDPRALVLVEWPERAGTFLPKADMTLTFSAEGAGEGERSITMETTSGVEQ